MKGLKNIFGHIFAYYALIVFVVTMLFIWFPVYFTSMLTEPKRSVVLHKVFKIWMGVYMPLIFCPVRRKGKHFFAPNENYVVVINHNSLMDIPVSSPWIPGPNKTLAKVEMAKTPLFGVIYRAGSILVDRKSEASRRGSFTQMQQALQRGLHLCLYPEGTRNKTNEPLQPFYDGAFITAIRSQKPVIPALIFNTKSILPQDKKFWAWPHTIHIHFLEPVPTAGLSMSDLQPFKASIHDLMKNYYTNNQPDL